MMGYFVVLKDLRITNGNAFFKKQSYFLSSGLSLRKRGMTSGANETQTALSSLG